jgi:hypothetical protein
MFALQSAGVRLIPEVAEIAAVQLGTMIPQPTGIDPPERTANGTSGRKLAA